MRRRIKVHATAVISIIVIITLLYLLFGPRAQVEDTGMATGDRYIQFYSADWGLNCNKEIVDAQRRNALTPPAPGQQPLKPSLPNNALPAVSALCDGRLNCTFFATDANLVKINYDNCYKNFKASYRCFETDRLRKIESEQGASISVDCSSQADTPVTQ
jgi:hypothetical protein